MKNRNGLAVQRWLQVWLALFLAIAAVGFPVQRVQAIQGNVPRFEPGPCMVDLPAGIEEGGRVECGYLVVPEQYANPDGPTIRLAVVIIKSVAENPAPDPLVMMQGGPGGSTIEDYSLALFSTQRILPNVGRDIILFDQRGTLYSQPNLNCEEIDQLTIDTLDQDLSDEESDRLFFEALQKCRDRLIGEGVNLSAFDSFENASDVESLRQALGYDQINLYGVSYGSLLALNVMRNYSEGLRSVIIDAVVPPQENFITTTAQSQQASFQKMFDSCGADADCNEAYPNLEQVFFDLVDRLNQEPVRIQLMDTDSGKVYPALFDGDALISTVFQLLYSTDLIPLLPRVIYDARAGRYEVIERVLSLVVFETTISTGMYYSVMCSEDADFNPEDIDLTNLPPQLLKLEERSGDDFIRTCQLWDVEVLGPAADEPVTSDVPTLVLSGEFDPVTPPVFGEEAAQSLPNSYSYVFPAGAHGSLLSGECQDGIILEFLDNPNQAPDDSCIANIQTPNFVTPGSIVRLPVLPRLLNLQGSSGIELALFGLGLLFLLTAFVIYPLVWLVRLFTRKPQPAAQPAYPTEGYPATPPASPVRREKPLIWRLAPLLALVVASLLLLFSLVLIGIIFNMVLQNDIRFLVGLPGSAAPLFILPLLAVLIVIGMLGLMLAAWLRGWGSAWGRVYFSLLSLSAVVVLAVLGAWGMLTTFFPA